MACRVWRGLGITGGARPWQRATLDFVALARSVSSAATSPGSVGVLAAAVGRRRPSALIDFDATHGPPVQLMNFHQTKGREADVVILVYRDDDYLAHWQDGEPYDEPSRVLFVSLTRARQRVIVVLPPRPHPLVARFLESARAAK